MEYSITLDQLELLFIFFDFFITRYICNFLMETLLFPRQQNSRNSWNKKLNKSDIRKLASNKCTEQCILYCVFCIAFWLVEAIGSSRKGYTLLSCRDVYIYIYFLFKETTNNKTLNIFSTLIYSNPLFYTTTYRFFLILSLNLNVFNAHGLWDQGEHISNRIFICKYILIYIYTNTHCETWRIQVKLSLESPSLKGGAKLQDHPYVLRVSHYFFILFHLYIYLIFLYFPLASWCNHVCIVQRANDVSIQAQPWDADRLGGSKEEAKNHGVYIRAQVIGPRINYYAPFNRGSFIFFFKIFYHYFFSFSIPCKTINQLNFFHFLFIFFSIVKYLVYEKRAWKKRLCKWGTTHRASQITIRYLCDQICC